MPNVDLVIKGGKIVNVNGIVEADIAIDNEKIIGISKGENGIKGEQTINAKGKLILPGFIDPHVHIFPWGRKARGKAYEVRKSTWETETTSAAFGGVTTLIDFVLNETNDDPITNIKESIDEASSRSIIDFSFHFSIGSKWNESDVKKYINNCFKEEIKSIKMYMCYRKEEFMIEDDMIYAAMKYLADKNGIPCIHAENGAIVELLKNKYSKDGRIEPEKQLESRPNFIEEEAVSTAIILAKETRVNPYIMHISTKEGLRAVLDARKKGQTIYLEANPNWTFFNQKDTKKEWPLTRETPPFRTKEDNEEVLNAIFNGQINTVGSDHSPNTISMKENGMGGLAGLETTMPIFYNECTKRGLSPSHVVGITSYNSAKIFGLKGKGSISIGYDADVILIDPKKEITIKADKLHTECDFTLFENWKIKGMPTTTIRRGEIICDEGEFYGKKGTGKKIERE